MHKNRAGFRKGLPGTIQGKTLQIQGVMKEKISTARSIISLREKSREK